jgi:GntR family transcriptional regulator
LQSNFTGPLYQQVHQNLKSRITAGEWTGGMAIPGDAELSRQLGVSIGTVRKALDELARQRLVVRERGRGTFIKDPSSWCGDRETWLFDADGSPLAADIEVKEQMTSFASAHEQKVLNQVAYRGSASRVHRLLRLWRHEDRVIGVERILVDAARLPQLLDEPDLKAPMLSEVYTRLLRKSLGRTDWSFTVSDADDPLMTQFDEPCAKPPVMCQRIQFDANDIPLEVSEHLIDLSAGTYRLSR